MSSGVTEYRPQRSLFSQQLDSEEERADLIDFKMVTFSLSGKDYGIDIMKVKEIAKFSSFTYVPNTPPFVSGVYNLRGDIISIIDLRTMLNLPAPEREPGEPADGLILRLESGLTGVIVDSIDRVVGISSDSIQPPHPIFADINLKYINGVVEHDEKLYIILEVERVLGRDSTAFQSTVGAPSASPRVSGVAPDRTGTHPGAPSIAPGAARAEISSQTDSVRDDAVAKEFVQQALASLRGFHVTKRNAEWFDRRFAEWAAGRSATEVQLQRESDAESFLEPFYSVYTDRFWGNDLLASVAEALPEEAPSFTVWNPGCGQGFETYSLACLIKRRFPEARLKIWAGDNDLLNVSTAPTLVFNRADVPEEMHQFLVEGKSGYSFTQEIRDIILFEYSDILHSEGLPPVDLIVARDLLSFLPSEGQAKAERLMFERLRGDGVAILGDNEVLDTESGFEVVHGGPIVVHRK